MSQQLKEVAENGGAEEPLVPREDSRHHDKRWWTEWEGSQERLRGKLWAILLDLIESKLEQVGKYTRK